MDKPQDQKSQSPAENSEQIKKQQTKKQEPVPAIQHPHYPRKPINIQPTQQKKQPAPQQLEQQKLQKQKAEVHNYFDSELCKAQVDKQYQNEALKLTHITQQQIIEGIKVGLVDIPQQKNNIDQILVQVSKVEQVDQQKMKRKAIQMQLNYLQKQIQKANKIYRRRKSQTNQDQLSAHIGQNKVLSSTQHKNFIKKLQKQRKQLEIRHKKVEEQENKRHQHEEKMRQIAEQQRLLLEKEEKIKKLVQSKQKQHQQHQQNLKKYQQAQKTIKQIKNRKHLYQQLQEKYQSQVVLPLLQEKKKKLKEIRDNVKGFNPTDLNTHQKQYIKRRQEKLMMSQAKSRQKSNWHYQKPAKSQRLAKILQQQAIQKRIQQQQAKRKQQQKKYRKEEYAALLREKYSPRTDPKLRQQIQKRLIEQQRQKSPINKKNGKILGQSYLDQIKKMRKKASNSQMKIKQDHSMNMVPSNENSNFESTTPNNSTRQTTNYLNTKNKTMKQYETMRLKRIDKLIKSSTTDNIDKYGKITQLQLQAQKLSQEQKRKEQILNLRKSNPTLQEEGQNLNLLLASIKTKMGIIGIYNNE